MSATFKLAKRKYTQNDLRRLMEEHKSKNRQQTAPKEKIQSPFAKYDDAGQLTCALCKSVVRSESVWKVHVNTKQHKANVEQAKELKEKLEKANALKRQGESTQEGEAVTSKKAKQEEPPTTTATRTPSGRKTPLPFGVKEVNGRLETAFDRVSLKEKKANGENIADGDGKKDGEPLPEDFFDQSLKDGKGKHDFKTLQEEEWERFQREIKEESTVSNAIIAVEQEEATAERQIEEIDEQIRKWSRVLDMEKRKEAVIRRKTVTRMLEDENSDVSDDDVENLDEFVDWRAKASHK